MSVSTISTGVTALDDVLGGGLVPSRIYLVTGTPGSGKTTLGLQFLLEGHAQGEPGLYITLSETREELLAVAESHGWNLDGIHIHELMSREDELKPDEQYTMFHPSEVELSERTSAILDEVKRVGPRRLVVDSLSEMRLLAQGPLRYRRQILALKQFFVGRDATVILLDDGTDGGPDHHLESLAHAVLRLENMNTEFGTDRRRLRVVKFRGRQFRGGYHDYRIARGGLQVFPRLAAVEHRQARVDEVVSSGIPGLDQLLGGGISVGSSVLLTGPAGSGKSTVAMRCAYEAALRGDRVAAFLFDESPWTLMHRCGQVGMPLEPHLETRHLSIEQVDPAEFSAGEFTMRVRDAVEGGPGRPGAKVIVIDSLNGYLQAMPGEKFLTIQLHELLSYLRQKGVLCILVLAQSGLVGSMTTPVDASYLADALVVLRYFESQGQVRQAISVMKNRTAGHEHTIREFRIEAGGIRVGEPLDEFQGVLTGTPVFNGSGGLMERGK